MCRWLVLELELEREVKRFLFCDGGWKKSVSGQALEGLTTDRRQCSTTNYQHNNKQVV